MPLLEAAAHQVQAPQSDSAGGLGDDGRGEGPRPAGLGGHLLRRELLIGLAQTLFEDLPHGAHLLRDLAH